MKKLVTLITLAWATLSPAQTAGQYIQAGTNALTMTNWWGAYTNFNAAQQVSPANEDANALLAVTRLMVLPQTPAGSNFLVTLGFPKTNRWMPGVPLGSLPQDANGYPVFPSGYNSASIVSFLRTNVLTAITNSLANLAAITDPGYTLTLSSSETLTESVTVDYGDIQLLRSMLGAAQVMIYTLNENNASTVMPTITSWFENGTFTWQLALQNYPSLLTLQNAGDLPTSKSALTNAIANYFAASAFIRNRPGEATGRLFSLDDGQTNEEAQFRATLTNVLASLNGPTELNPGDFYSTINASNWFAGVVSLKSFLPKFNGNLYVTDTFTNYTLSGILPYMPAYKMEETWRTHWPWHSYAGIYIGDNGQYYNGNPAVADNQGYPGYQNGSFAVFIGTNQFATLMGHDDGDGTDDGSSFGLVAQFKVDKGGSWNVNSNNFSGYGNVGSDGSFWGELDYNNGTTVWLSGAVQPPQGPYQNPAGYYAGSFSGSHSGTLLAIIAPDKEVFYIPVQSSGVGNGGSANFYDNNTFTNQEVTGSVVGGTLNTNNFTAGGSWNSGPDGSGTWSLSRAAFVPFDVPPVITKDLLTSTNIVLGSNVMFSLTVTGSPPLSYQWYFNGSSIPGAMAGTLVVSNQLWASTGSYTISATVNNCAGGTNSQICQVNVTPETTSPTIAITNITPGMLVSNAAFTVMGTAFDNVAVSNVFVAVSNSAVNTAFAPAATTNWPSWTAPVTLAPGTNLVSAFAVDNSGNVSATTNVRVVYVVSALLTVQTNGRGAITPTDNGAMLAVGVNYALTASPIAGSGFMFTNWTGGIGAPTAVLTNGPVLQFRMQNNLVLQANFVDTNKPALAITNLVAGQRLSNGVFIVKGTAGDNWQVSNVLCQVNGGAWNSATNINNWTNWAAGVVLVPGTNTVAAYAVDTTGNLSTTNRLSCQFVVTNQLGLRASGLGTISPNYSNAWLNVGQNYSITATPAGGFIVTNWTISTNWLGNLVTNNATVQFMMASNLTLQVNFADVTKPTLTVSSPTAGQHMTNALANLKGTASDNWKVAGVWYQLNGNAWNLVTTTNGYTNWTKIVTLVAGTNTLKIYALDLGGNYSTTNNISVLSSNDFKLQLAFASGQPLGVNGLNFVLQVSTNVNGHIQVSTDLLNWVTLTNFTGSNATLNFRDAAATNYNSRFYRAVIP